MSTQHPITPPPELEEKWYLDYWSKCHTFKDVVKEIAQWGADQALKAAQPAHVTGLSDADIKAAELEWRRTAPLWARIPRHFDDLRAARELRNSRRPKPPSLNSIALQMLGTIEREGHYIPEITDTIRRALEASMTKQHRATPEQWETIEKYADSIGYSCILELRAHIEALEELHKAVVDFNERFNLDSLVERVETLERTQQQPYQDKLDRLIAIDRDDSTEDAAQPLFTAEEVARIVAPTVKDSLTDPAGSLLKRLGKVLERHNFIGEIERSWDAQGRAVILEVAAWLVEQSPEPGPVGKWLGQISTPFAVMADMLRDEANR